MLRSAAKNIRLLEVHTALLSAMFVVPVIIPYYRDEIGLSFQDFLIGEVAFAIVLLLLEVPSGWLSDVWKRKHVLALGSLFELAGFGCLLVADSLAMAVIAQAIIGIAISLYSGTNSAILFDSLLECGREKEFGKLEGRRNGISMYSIGIASIAGGFLYAVDTRLPLYVTIAALILALIAAVMMTEPERHKSAIQGHPLTDMVVTMRYALQGHIEVGLILLFSAALFCATKLNMWIQQPYYMALDIPEIWFGVLMALGYLTGGMASHFSHVMFRRVSNVKALAYVWAVAILACLAAGVYMGFHGIVMLMIGGSLIYGAATPRVQEAINIRVGSERRATILSTASLLRQVAFIPLGLIIGAMVDDYGVGTGLIGVAAWLLASGAFLVLWAAYRRTNNIAKTIETRSRG